MYYYHHLYNLLVLFFIIPSLVNLLTINSDVLIIPKNAQHGFVLLEETKSSRFNEFNQCLKQNNELNIDIDKKYGDLILNKTIENYNFTQQQRLLCTINRNQSSILKLYYTIIDSSNDVVFTSPIYHMDPIRFVVHRFKKIECLSSSSIVNYEFVDSSIPLNINSRTGKIYSKDECINLNEILIKCYDIYDRKKNAYAKIIFDQICQKNSIKKSNINWINKIGEERRKRIHYQQEKISSNQLYRHRRQQSIQPPSRLAIRFNESYIGSISEIKYCRKQTSKDHLEQTFQFPLKYEIFLRERVQINEQGQLFILRPFDYELFQTITFQFHCLILEQQNGGMNLTRVNKTEDIQLIIDDINDELPRWIMDEPYQYGTYFGYVEKTARPETPVFRFKAFDPDTTSKLTYEIVNGDKNLFHLSSDGTLTTHSNQQLLSPTYNLTVRAVDLNSQVPSMTRSNPAHLVIRTDRFEPKFFKERYIFNVSEYTQPSTIIGTIRAKSFSTKSENLRYFLQQSFIDVSQINRQSNSISGNSGDMYEFKIDETEGSIKILKMLRYSDQHNNNTKFFTGVVKELSGWQMQSHVEIEIHVIDINDKIPTFKQTYYTPQISEDYPLNTPIINFTVTDDDARNTPNSNITLDLIDPYGKFSIYNDSRISTSNNIQAYLIAKERLDYESLSPLDRQYKLKIIARDHGQPQSLQSEAQIYITITDVNDEPPVFKENPVQKTIAENTQRGTFVVFVDVVDTEYNDSVTVQFLPTSQYNPFRIITSPGGGRVILEQSLLPDKEFYNLTMQASDRLGHTSQAQLLITIYDVNDHTPRIEQCEQGIIIASIRENATLNTPIIKINATDQDRGLNGEIQFSLKGTNDPQQDSDMFSIDSDTGLVTNKKKLKHLKSGFSEYAMTIFAQDKDPSNSRSTHCILKITVEDINDHYPVITSPARDNDLISIKMEKRVNFNYPVLVVRAKDEDSGKNALLHFSLKSRDDCSNGIQYFVIDSQSGVISTRSSNVNNPINLQIKYCLVVQVCDSPDDGPSKCSERKIQFQLSQDGFEPPVWAPETALTFQRVMKVVELAQQNIVIDTFKASIANDATKKVIFEMEPFNWTCSNVALASEKPRIPFLLTPDESGRNIARLVIYQPIDADPPTGCTRYQFKIRAKNAAMEALSLESIYEIEIVDSNDNIPMFNVSSYRAQIYENEIKDNLLRVQAEDKDIDPKNRNTTYFIRCPNDGNHQNLQYHYNSPLSNSLSCQGIVSIDPETGWISVQRQFDYDNPADRRFVFDVFAKNILPSDRCSGQNTKESQAQSSSLSSGADANPTIQICVTEHRVPVIIEVLDRNDNAPQFNNLPYFTKVIEDAEPGTTIFHLNVSDIDTDDILTFSIVNEQEASAFAVKENTGEVYLASALDYERVQQHSVEVQVSDSNNEHRARTILTVIVEDANDNPPRFLNLPREIIVEEGRQTFDYDQLIIRQPLRLKRDARTYKKQKDYNKKRISISTKLPEEFYDDFSSQQPYTSRIIYRVEAIDPDFGRPLKLPIRYTLTSSNPLYTQFFEIHPLNGTIHLKQELDRDPPNGFDEWLLTIIAADEDGREDMGSKKNASWLKIIVKDINDLPPMFIDVDPIGHIPENARAGTRVEGLRIKATDYDKLSENTTRYALTLNTKSIDGSDVFRIDEITADIYLNVDNYLDREKTPHHNLSIIARDSGDQSGNLQSKELKITIIIDDVNDMPPRFKPKNQQAQISETAQRGDFVTEVRAEDDDIGVNTHSLYEIIEECQLSNEHIIRCSRPKYFIFKETALAEKGTIILLEPVNYDPPDNQNKFLLKIKATNGGMSDYANVTVFITDANDNVPVFSQSVYFANISEETSLEQEILRVHATDNDVNPINKEFIYRIPPDRSQYENRQHLRIDAIDGRIYLKKNFDREKSSTISLPIEAVNNQSSIMLIGRAVLVINVLDVNDNYPRFAENYLPRIREHTASRKILEFKINDPDDQNSGKNKFRVKLGKNNVWPESGEPKFRLDIQYDNDGKPRGTLSTLRELDREELCLNDDKYKNQRYCGKYYDLPIWMSDGEQSGINPLRVLVEDINDNPFSSGYKSIDIYDYKHTLSKVLSTSRIYIGTVFADDEDDWDFNNKIFELQPSDDNNFLYVDKNMHSSRTPGAIYLTMQNSNATIKHGISYKYDVIVRDTHPQWLNRDSQTSYIEFRLHDLPSDAFDNAASIRLQDITAEEFIETRHRHESSLSIFKRIILEIIPNARHIDVFSIQNHEYLSRTIDIYYAIHGSGYLSKIKINGLVEISRKKFENYFNISQIDINECLNSDQQCFTIGCLNKIELQSKQPYLINANQTSFIGLNIKTIAQCSCDTDINIQQEKQKDLLKTHKYCLNGGYPTRDNHHIKCMCPDQTLYNGGERCQLTSISFDGNGYAWYKPLTTCDTWMLSIEFLTQTYNGSILYNGPLNKKIPMEDYFSLQLLNGHLLIDLNFGYGKNIRRHLKTSTNLADGKWHIIEIRQISTIEHILEILIDYCPLNSVSKQYGECRFMIEFNEDDVFSTNRPLQLGGIALEDKEFNQQQLPMEYMGNFKGCIRNLRFADELYDLHVDLHSDQSINLHEGCLLTDLKCQKLSCQSNNGICDADLYQVQCLCKPGRTGSTCSQETVSYDFTYDKQTWTGDRASYATFRHQHKPDNDLSYLSQILKFQIMFRTREISDNILTLIDFHNDDTFMFLEIKSGHLQARFGSKSDTQLIELKYILVNDGRWHTAYLDRYGQRLILRLDDGEYYRTNISYGKSIWKHFPNTLLNVGARIDSAVHKIVTADFNDGCIMDVRFNGQLLDLLNGSSSSDMKWTFQSNIKEGCDNLDNWCRGVQCRSPAFCVNTWRHGQCQCTDTYKYNPTNETCILYDWCTDITNPCHMPGTKNCLYEARENTIKCECKLHWQGERCIIKAMPLAGTFHWHIIGAIILSLLSILFLVLLLILLTRRRQTKKAYILGMDDEIRDNIINYDEEGCPDEDPVTYDISTLKKPVFTGNGNTNINRNGRLNSESEIKPLLKTHTDGNNQIDSLKKQTATTTRKDMPPIPIVKPVMNKNSTNNLNNGINVGEFIKGRIRDIDDDPSQPPYDSLQEYAYEGEPLARNDECTLSTLTITSKDQNDIDKELELEYLKNMGPKFQYIAKLYSGNGEKES
ncbi:unnamed protein product [Rotaria sordida]|uniref:Uncharacterized protein n=1 Tax=Rotaria sordida TaxID=392033 RepID=A0A818FJC4_9BILA|nr:unnamed protein product [Rotaria sordida]CAF3475904.1 unnamed protein product [Rotaria sordida]